MLNFLKINLTIPLNNDEMVKLDRSLQNNGTSHKSFEPRSKRIKTKRSFGLDFIVYLVGVQEIYLVTRS